MPPKIPVRSARWYSDAMFFTTKAARAPLRSGRGESGHSKKLEGRIWSNPLGKSDIESTDCTVTSGINNDAAASTASTTVPANAASARVPGVKGRRFMMSPLFQKAGVPMSSRFSLNG